MTSYRLVKTAFATTAALGIQCLACGLISYNVHDIRERYCGSCHVFHEDADVPRGTSPPRGGLSETTHGGD